MLFSLVNAATAESSKNLFFLFVLSKYIPKIRYSRFILMKFPTAPQTMVWNLLRKVILESLHQTSPLLRLQRLPDCHNSQVAFSMILIDSKNDETLSFVVCQKKDTLPKQKKV